MINEQKRLNLRVSKVRELTPSIRVFELRHTLGQELPLVTAGSHICIEVEVPSSKKETRQYAICSNPAQRDFYEIAVQKAEQSRGGSDFIFNHFNVGTHIQCDIPVNNFQLHADSSPAILMAEGIGIAPIKAIAHTLALRGRRFILHYAGTRKTDMAFLNELEATFPRQVVSYAADENKPLDVMNLLADATGNTLFYACGSNQLLDDIETSARLLSIHKDRIQLESFSTSTEENEKAVLLELAYSNKLIQVDSGQSLLAALRDAGAPVRFDCCVGDCGTCALKVLEGEVEHRDHVLSDTQKAQGLICVCVSRAKSEKLVLVI